MVSVLSPTALSSPLFATLPRCLHGHVRQWCTWCLAPNGTHEKHARRFYPPIRLQVCVAQLQELAELQVRERDDCVACFSCNAEDIWPFVTWGWTPPWLRLHIDGLCPLLDQIVRDYRKRRPVGGRIFITWDGAFDWPMDDSKHQFVIFDLSDDPLLN